MIFVDPGVWYAYTNISDRQHQRAVEIIHQQDGVLVTTWPVVWETLTLMVRQLGGQAAARFGKDLVAEKWARILELTTTDHVLALDFMSQFAGLRLSAADATSCAIVRRMNIDQIASFDQDFRVVLPERAILGLAPT